MSLSTIIHLVIGGVASAIFFSATLILLSRYRKDKGSATLSILSFFGALFIWSVLSTVYPISSSEETAVMLYQIAVFFSYIAFFMMFVFSQLVRTAELHLKKTIYYSFLLGAIFIILVGGHNVFYAMPVIEDFGYYAEAFPSFLLFQFMFILPSGIDFIIATNIMRKKAISESTRSQTRMILVGAIIAIPGTIIALVLVEVFFVPSLVLLIASIGALLTTMAYAKNSEVAYIVPFECSKLIILNKINTPVYSYNFKDNVEKNQTEVLLSGVLSAINSVFSSSFAEKNEIRLIELEKTMLLVYQMENFKGVLIANKNASVLRNALIKFLDYFEKTFKEYNCETLLSDEDAEKANLYFAETFSFVLRK